MNMDSLKKAAEKLKDKVLYKSPLDKILNEATNDENWTTPTSLLHEIAEHTYSYNDFNIIMKHIWDKVNQKGKKWRKLLKTLNMMEFLAKNGSPRCVGDFKDEIYQLRTLQDYHLTEGGVDRGQSIRDKAKEVIELITDDQRLESERENAKRIKDKLQSIGGNKSISNESYGNSGGNYNNSSANSKYEGYGSSVASSSIARKYEGYSGDSKYYDSGVNKDNNDKYKYDKYDRYDNNNKYRSDNDVKEKPQEKNVFEYKENNNSTKIELKQEPKIEPKINEFDNNLKNFKLPKPGEKVEPKKDIPAPKPVQPIQNLIDMDEQPQPKSAPIQNPNNMWNFPANEVNPKINQTPNIQNLFPNPQINSPQPQNTNWNWNQPTNNPPPVNQFVPPQNQFVPPQNQFVPPQNQFNPPINNIISQNNQMNLNQIQFNSPIIAPVQKIDNNLSLKQDNVKKATPVLISNNDQFEDFQSANPVSKDINPSKPAYKNFNDAESNLINLSDLGKSDKKVEKNQASFNKQSDFDPPSNLLLTTQYDLDNFGISLNNRSVPPKQIYQNPQMMGQMGYNPMGMGQMGMGQMGMGQMGMGPMMGPMGMQPMGGQMGMQQMGYMNNMGVSPGLMGMNMNSGMGGYGIKK